MFNSRLINTKVAGGGGGCTDIVDNYDPFGGGGVALYQLNGNANDVSGNYNGTATNVTYGTGVFGQAGIFNGSSSKISTSITTNNIGVDFNNRFSNFTFSAWFNTTALDSTDRRIISIGQGASTYKYIGFKKVNSEIRFEWYTGATGGGIIHPISANTWYNIVGVRESGFLKLYINGSFIGQAEQTVNNSITSSATLTIGAHTVSTNYFNGSIDQVRIFNTALPPLEVEALYTEELCICDGTVDTLDILGDGSCIATYQLDGNANDLSGNYSGTPTNVSYGVGEFDLAGVFNGSSSYIGTNYFSNSNLGSVSLWVKTTDSTACFFGANGNGDTNRFYFGVRNSNFWNGAGNTQKYTVNATSLLDNNWHNVVFVLNGSTAKYYVDGLEVDSTNYSSLGLLDTSAGIGVINTDVYGYNYSYALNGSIDQVRIFNKALSSSEVTTLYNETTCTKAACTGTTNTLDILGDSSCIAAYPLDGSPLDLSGNYNGVQTNVTYPQGYFDLAGSFNNGYIDLGRDSNGLSGVLNQKVSQSVSFWMNASSPGLAGNSVIYSVYAGGGISLNIYYFADGTLYFFTRYSNVSTDYQTVQTFNDSQWHHIAVSIDIPNLQRKVYIDNILVSTQSLPSNSYGAAGTDIGVAIGTNGNFNTQYYNGRLDQLRIFNKPITASEVTTLYNETPCN